MPARTISSTGKRSNKTSSKSSQTQSKPKVKKTSSKPSATQHKPKPQSSTLRSATTKKAPPHTRYSEKQLAVPQLNGIRPASGVKKAVVRAKKGKKFTDDGEGMRTILALVMAEKAGDIESKMIKARRLEEVREARRAEAESRSEEKRESLEGRKRDIKESRKKFKRTRENDDQSNGERQKRKRERDDGIEKKSRKKVSFG